MSYAIHYGPHRTKEERKDDRKKFYYLGIFLIVVLGALGLLWPQGMETLRLILFPWADGPTLEAIGDMVDRVGEGTSIPDALFVFCREVISNAGILS